MLFLFHLEGKRKGNKNLFILFRVGNSWSKLRCSLFIPRGTYCRLTSTVSWTHLRFLRHFGLPRCRFGSWRRNFRQFLYTLVSLVTPRMFPSTTVVYIFSPWLNFSTMPKLHSGWRVYLLGGDFFSPFLFFWKAWVRLPRALRRLGEWILLGAVGRFNRRRKTFSTMHQPRMIHDCTSKHGKLNLPSFVCLTIAINVAAVCFGIWSRSTVLERFLLNGGGQYGRVSKPLRFARYR